MTRSMEKSCPANDGFAMAAEWSPHARTWMSWPCRVDAWGSDERLLRAKQAFARVALAISAFEPVTMAARPTDISEVQLATAGKVEIFEVALDDSWMRDTGPTFLSGAASRHAAVQWTFNAWGNKYLPFAQDAALASKIARKVEALLYDSPLICEGGALHTDGEGTLLTTEQCLLNANRNPKLEKQAVERLLMGYTGTQRIIWLGGVFSDGETDGHVDNIACFAGPERILIGMPADKSHPDYEPVRQAVVRLRDARDAKGRPLEVIEVMQPSLQRRDWRGRLMAASYINFCVANGAIVMPSFDDPNDDRAQAVLSDCFPGRDILQIDALDIVQGGGGIHCITLGEPAAS